MTDVQAAIGREQLKRLARDHRATPGAGRSVCRALAAIDGVSAPAEPEWARQNWQSYCVRLDDRIDQRALMQAMLDQGVATRRGIMCIHLEPAYADLPVPHPLPHSERARDGSVLLPLFAQMDEATQDRVLDALVAALAVQRPTAADGMTMRSTPPAPTRR